MKARHKSFTDPDTHYRLITSATPPSVAGYRIGEPTGEAGCDECGAVGENIDEIEVERTDLGFHFATEYIDTMGYWQHGGWQSIVTCWVDLCSVVEEDEALVISPETIIAEVTGKVPAASDEFRRASRGLDGITAGWWGGASGGCEPDTTS